MGRYLWQLSLDAVDHPGLALGGLKQLVELLGVELQALQQPGRPGHDQQQLLDEAGEESGRLRGLVPRLDQQLLQVLAQLVKVPGEKEAASVHVEQETGKNIRSLILSA